MKEIQELNSQIEQMNGMINFLTKTSLTNEIEISLLTRYLYSKNIDKKEFYEYAIGQLKVGVKRFAIDETMQDYYMELRHSMQQGFQEKLLRLEK